MTEKADTGTSEVSRKHQLTIIFDGVIAVGPPHPQDGKPRQGPFFGVMARSTRRLSDRSRRLKENPPNYIPMHVPTVYTTTEPVKPEAGGRRPDQVYQRTEHDPKWYIWHPIRERLEFRFDGNGAPGTLTYDESWKGGRGSKMGSGVKIHSVKDVPDARAIWPERVGLLEGLMSAEAPVRQEAEAQILVPWGDVNGSGIFDKKDGVEVLFDPDRTATGKKRVVPNVAVVVQAESVEIATYSLDTGERLDPIKIFLNEDTELWVSNGDPSDTAIDLAKHSAQLGHRDRERMNEERIENAVNEGNRAFGNLIDPANFRKIVRFIIGGGGVNPPDVQDNQIVRQSKVDIDFELFYSITRRKDLEIDGRGLPVPVKADGTVFDGPNCLVKQVECPDPLRMKSND